MSDFKIGDTVRCIETWTTHVIDRGDEYTVEVVDLRAPVRLLINGQWVPASYFEKVDTEPVINWAEIAGTMTARAVNAEQRAEKAEASLRESDAALQAAREACPYGEPGHVLCDCAQMWKTRAEVTQVNATYWFRQDADRRKEIDVLGARLRRVEAQVEEWEQSAAQPIPGAMRDWASVHAVQMRAALADPS